MSIVGCATQRDLPTCQRPAESNKKNDAANPVWPGAKVALAAGRFSPPNTLDTASHDVGTPVNPAALAGAGAAVGTAECLQGIAVLGPFVVFCFPVGAVGGAIWGVAKATEYERNISANEKWAAEKANTKAAEEHVAAGVQLVDLNRLLLERVRQYAQDSGVGDLPELSGQGPTSLSDHPQYHGEQDFVFEMILTGSVVEQTDAESYMLRFYVQGRLIRVADNVAVDVFTTTEVTDPKSRDEWNAENGKLVEQELKNALGRIAKKSVDEWIRPTVHGNPNLETTVVIFRPNMNFARWRTYDIAIDGCKVGSLSNDSYVIVKLWTGKHLMRAEGVRPIGGLGDYVSEEINVAPGKTRYFVLDNYAGWYFLEIDKSEVEAQFPSYKESVR